MKILFDGTTIFDLYKMGLSTYAYEIVKNITELDKTNRYFLGVRPSRWKNIREVDMDVRIKRIFSLDLMEDRFIPIALTTGKFDIYHGLSNKLCFGILARRYVLTLHDHYGKRDKVRMMSSFADIVITISQFAKERISEKYGIREEKIRVVYNGVSSIFSRKEEAYIDLKKKEFESKYGGGMFILCVITDDTYPNIKKIVFTVDLITRKHRDVKALFVGKDVSQYIEPESRDRLILIGYVQKETLCELYNISDVLFFPAVSGGFGLPVVEAMACGCPVITSRGTAQDEISGDSALKCDPNSEEEMLEHLEKILFSADLRNEFSLKGIQRAKLFSWKKAADSILRIYKEIS